MSQFRLIWKRRVARATRMCDMYEQLKSNGFVLSVNPVESEEFRIWVDQINRAAVEAFSVPEKKIVVMSFGELVKL